TLGVDEFTENEQLRETLFGVGAQSFFDFLFGLARKTHIVVPRQAHLLNVFFEMFQVVFEFVFEHLRGIGDFGLFNDGLQDIIGKFNIVVAFLGAANNVIDVAFELFKRRELAHGFGKIVGQFG